MAHELTNNCALKPEEISTILKLLTPPPSIHVVLPVDYLVVEPAPHLKTASIAWRDVANDVNFVPNFFSICELLH